MKSTKEVVLIKNVHPNEEAAGRMADLLGEELKQRGLKTKLVCLPSERVTPDGHRISWAQDMARNKLSRNKLVQNIVRTRSNQVTIEVHDSDYEELKKHVPLDKVTMFRSDYIRPHFTVEFMAVYVPQEDEKVKECGRSLDNRIAKYFTHRSDLHFSQKAGLCGTEAITKTADWIVEKSLI